MKVYRSDNIDYDVSKFSEAGQTAFELLEIADKKLKNAHANYIIASAAVVTLGNSMQDYLTDDAKIEE